MVKLTVFAPAVFTPVVQVALFVETTDTEAQATPPISTLIPVEKAAPESVTLVPPARGPAFGLNELIDGLTIAPLASFGACTSPTTQPVATITKNRRAIFKFFIILIWPLLYRDLKFLSVSISDLLTLFHNYKIFLDPPTKFF